MTPLGVVDVVDECRKALGDVGECLVGHLVFLHPVRSLGVLIEGAGLVFLHPQTDQVARQVVPLSKAMQRLAGDELLRDLTFERDAVRSMRVMGSHPLKARPTVNS